jgi:tRNA(Arg) A34 adenosine deaminase TadA
VKSYDNNLRFPEIHLEYPGWVRRKVDWLRPYAGDRDRTRVAIEVARENVLQGSGGPFGAAIFEEDSGRLVAVGVNRVVPLNNSVLHAEVFAFMMAQAALGSFTLAADGMPSHTLYSSCEPCAMCLGAAQWSGVRRVVWSAMRDDARRLNFDEGPVFPESYEYLRERGMSFDGGVLRDEGRSVLEEYRSKGGVIYNA